MNIFQFSICSAAKKRRLQEKMAATDAAIKTQAGVGWRAGQVWHSRCRAHCAAMGSLQRHHCHGIDWYCVNHFPELFAWHSI